MDLITPRARWAGRVVSAIPALFLAFDGITKVVRVPAVVAASAELGLAESSITPLGLVLLACLALYLVPRTALLGAILLTGYLGGAVAIHVRAGDPLFSHTLFPIYVGAMVWGGGYLRDRRFRALAPFGKIERTPVDSRQPQVS